MSHHQDDLLRNGAALYHGTIMHARLKPFVHRFSYRVFSILVDIDRLDEADRLRWFSHNRFNLFSFHDCDHGSGDGSPLRPHIETLLQKVGVTSPCPQILLLCYPRVLGYVFNPLSVYYCCDPAGDIIALVYEVRNTFGGKHAYVAPVTPGQASPAGIRQTGPKKFYVSPFFGMDMAYNFRVQPPGDSINLRILQTEHGKPVFAAGFAGKHKPFCDRNLLQAFARIPFLTLKVIVSIHWQALLLWLKGARFTDMPATQSDETLLDEKRRLVSH